MLHQLGRANVDHHQVSQQKKCVEESLPSLTQPSESQRPYRRNIALEQAILAVMQGHVYQFDGNVYRQSDGEPIGLELSGALGRVFMHIWDRKFLSLLEKSTRNIEWDLHFMKRYVDDTNAVTDVMPAGARFEKGKIRIKPEYVESDEGIDDDVRTAKVIQEVANSIFPFIQM